MNIHMSGDDELEKIKAQMMRRIMSPQPTTTSVWGQGRVVELSDVNFSKIMTETNVPVLVDFWADWCGPCKIMAPVVAQLAGVYQGKVGFAKLNTDQNPMTAKKYGVMSIPNFIIFRNSKPVDQVVGAVGRQGLEALILRQLSR